jgi:predicted dehydrogenase
MFDKIKIGVIGAGHLGKIHLKCLLQSELFDVVGFYDSNESAAKQVAEQLSVTAFKTIDSLLEHSEAIDIVTPTLSHFDIAMSALQAGKHIFVEKPITNTVEEARKLIEIATQKKLVGQVGHVERFNPAFLSVQHLELSPMFVEVHRLSNFNPRGTDVSVVLDLMIHDLDIVLKLIKSPLKEIRANGVCVICDTPDIANVRLMFENGAVANLTASRISMKQMRKIRLFQQDAYISLDFLEKKSEIIRLYESEDKIPEGVHTLPIETGKSTKHLYMEMPEAMPVNAIQMELECFAKSIRHGEPVAVSLQEGYDALALSYEILKSL